MAPRPRITYSTGVMSLELFSRVRLVIIGFAPGRIELIQPEQHALLSGDAIRDRDRWNGKNHTNFLRFGRKRTRHSIPTNYYFKRIFVDPSCPYSRPTSSPRFLCPSQSLTPTSKLHYTVWGRVSRPTWQVQNRQLGETALHSYRALHSYGAKRIKFVEAVIAYMPG